MGSISELVAKGKSWYKSKTIIGIVIAFLPQMLKVFGYDIDLFGVETIVIDGIEQLATKADGIWSGLVQAFGSSLAIWGRIKANVPISIGGQGGKDPK